MLASITPLGERGRNRNWATTASFYVLGSVLGGTTRGMVLGGLGSLIPVSVRPSAAATAWLLAGMLVMAAAVEAGWIRFPVPTIARQVNEDWLDQYRGWVIGFGFGYQLGLALVVYITTASLWVVFAAEVLTFSMLGGMALGALFGLIRTFPLLATARIRTPQQLRAAHTLLDRTARPMERIVTAACGLGAIILVLGAAL